VLSPGYGSEDGRQMDEDGYQTGGYREVVMREAVGS
jgi:hypothetical protein